MTAPPGHVGIGLLLAAPAWFLLSGEDMLAFLRYVGMAVLLPDIDVYVQGVPHRGVTHTVPFVVAVALAGGLLAVAVSRLTARRWVASRAPSSGKLFALAAGGALLGGLSHLFLDVLSYSAVPMPLTLGWPLLDQPFAYAAVYYTDPVVNYGLLAAGLVANLTIVSLRISAARRSPAPAR